MPNDVTSSDRLLTQSCLLCPKPVRVRVLTGYSDSKPQISGYCLDCVEAASTPSVKVNKDAGSFALLLAHIGLAFGVVGAFSDWILIESESGFGFHQQVGIALGVISFTLGVMLRIDLMVVGGLVLFALAAGADMISSQPGYGWRQDLLLKGGLLIVALSLTIYVIQRRGRKKLAPVPEPKSEGAHVPG